MPAADRLDAAIARLADAASAPKEVLTLAEAYDKLRHAGEDTEKADFAASGADMLDGSDSFGMEENRRKRVGFSPQRPLAY